MSQHDMNIANADGATVRADLNNALAALVSQSSGATAPSTTFAYMWWADTTTGILKRRNAANSAWISVMDLAAGLIVGTDVQAYDADTAKLDVDQSWTGSQRGTITTDNDLSFDLSAANNFSCTPGSSGTLTFTNIASSSGQSGTIKLVNGSNYTISAHTNTKITSANLTTVSATGTYLIGYFCDGTDVFCTASGKLA
jgi:hypothetical protein